ncbi:MAG TPA: maleylpyruvate isomerase N-terminal domain-containing protein [Acidimicrobiales bacterium]|nr:maleylpyruvate isomerase N-terminal domain-containing protein [Acidimicrobiales bacterium]
MPDELVPSLDLARVDAAQRRFESAIAGLDEACIRRPSLLAGWSVAHVLAHVARNGESHVRRARAAASGEVVEQYPGGYEGRERAIQTTAERRANEILQDVRETAAELHAVWRAVPEHAWDGLTRDVAGRERPLRELPSRRWQELEVHLVDLDVGITWDSWPDEFVAEFLPRLRSTRAGRLPSGASPPDTRALTDRQELAWLYGRHTGVSLPPLAPWG